MHRPEPASQSTDNLVLSPERPHMNVRPPAPEYVGPSPNVMHGNDGRPLVNTPKLIVEHGTVTQCVAGERYAVARLFKEPGRFASAHYVVDPGGIVQVVHDHEVADHCGLNPDSIGIEHTIELPSQAWDLAHAARWKDDAHQAVIRKGANLTARLCLAYGIPSRRVTVDQLKAWVAGGRRHTLGIVGHDTVTEAFPNLTTHWDPGPAFPWAAYMAQVHKHQAYLLKKARAGK